MRTVFHAHFECGTPVDYVQLKDVAVALEAHHPTCHQRLCYKAGTRVPSNDTLATVVSRVAGVDVRNAQVTMPGQVKVRGPIKGFRKVCAWPPGPAHAHCTLSCKLPARAVHPLESASHAPPPPQPPSAD